METVNWQPETEPTAARSLSTLHITNGQAIIPLMRQAGIGGPILPWEDILHEGPVPAGLGTASMRDRRADFIASCGWRPRDLVVREIERRDDILDRAIASANGGPPEQARSGRMREIVLWFEHDLYDQLQLIQILDRISVGLKVRHYESDLDPVVTIVRATTYLGYEPVDRFAQLFATRRLVSSAERVAASDAWDAFTAADPRAIVDVISRVGALAHIQAALLRHLEQFPSVGRGLSRTEQQTLEIVAGGVTRLDDVFTETNRREEAMFMGDSAFAFHISPLVRGPRPLLRVTNRPTGRTGEFVDPVELELEVDVTPEGERVLAGQMDRIALCGIDRWLGGVQLAGRGPVWRWDRDRQAMRFV